MAQIHKYPRTQHIEGSRLQPGDEDLESIPFEVIRGRHLVVEEKMDGANSAVSFSPEGYLRLQSRGHYLTGGPREKHFSLLKQWASTHADRLHPVLRDRYVMYGEWLYAKHTVFYNNLPHYFLEFDILDQETGAFLDLPSRRRLLKAVPVTSVAVLHEGPLDSLGALRGLLGQSHFIRPGHLHALREECLRRKLDPERALRQTDRTTLMEGLYIKVEEDGMVKERYKFIRPTFLTAVLDADGHWLNRPIIPNQLRNEAELFA